MNALPDRLNGENEPPPRPDREADDFHPSSSGAHEPGTTGAAAIFRSEHETETGITLPANPLETDRRETSSLGDWRDVSVARRYLTKDQLGAGGMGEVYLAHDEHLKTNVVLKVPKRSLVSDMTTVERFEREIRSLVKLSHPHIVKIHDVGRHGQIPFAVMQYLEGGGLDARRPRSPSTGRFVPLGPADAIGPWITQIGKALDFVHASGYLHRDVKPGNILFDLAGNAYLSDFGVAKFVSDAGQFVEGGDITNTGTAPGTGPYQAPEVLGGAAPTPAADQYALAVTAFELICGRKPFVGKTRKEAVFSRLLKPAPAINAVSRGVPARMARAIARGLSRDPSERFPSCSAFAEELLAAVPIGEAATPTPETATFACPCCNEPIEVDARLTSQPFSCPHCSRLILGHPRLLWLEAAGREASTASRRLEELATAGSPACVLPCPACRTAIGIAQPIPLKKGGCPACAASLRLTPDTRRLELLSAPVAPQASLGVVAPPPVPSSPMPSARPPNPFQEFERIGHGLEKAKSGSIRNRYEKTKRRQEEIAMLVGLASLGFMGLVGYLVFTAMVK